MQNNCWKVTMVTTSMNIGVNGSIRGFQAGVSHPRIYHQLQTHVHQRVLKRLIVVTHTHHQIKRQVDGTLQGVHTTFR